MIWKSIDTPNWMKMKDPKGPRSVSPKKKLFLKNSKKITKNHEIIYLIFMNFLRIFLFFFVGCGFSIR